MKQPFERAVEDHGSTVLRVCRAVLGAGPDADDAWSETFTAAIRAWPELPEGTNVEAWLVTVAHRKAIDVLRTRNRHAVPVEEVPDSGLSTEGVPHAIEPDLWSAVAKLPERQRLAIAYHYLGGLPHKDTADLIGGSVDAVRRAAADGIKNLRASYATGARRKGILR
jgi:RNA polymerase sigma factor (sigma-70 family)